MHRLLNIVLLVLLVAGMLLSCKVHQDTRKHKLFHKATVKRSNSKDTVAVIKQK